MAFAQCLRRIPWIGLASLATIANAGAQGVAPRQSEDRAPAPARSERTDAKGELRPPSTLHFCAAHCSTWYLTNDGSGYAGVAGYPSIPKNSPGVMIERFTHDAVVLDR